MFRKFPCIQTPCSISPERKEALRRLLQISFKESFLSDFYLLGIFPFILDLKNVAGKGLEGIKEFQVMVFEPIRPMLAERLASPEEILEKLGGKCVAEYKYDGERFQAHKKDGKVVLFSRRLENISDQYPDAVELIKPTLLPKM
jgi:hypothetical protein